MTHKDDASFLPGGAAQLATLADPVYQAVDSRAVEDLATRFTVAGGQVVATTDKTKAVVASVDGAWDGASAESFVNYMNSFAAAGQAVSDTLNNVANDLRTAGTALEQARDVLEGVFANLVTEVQTLQSQATDGDDTDSKISEVVERYRPQVTQQVEAANGVLTNAATAVTGRLAELKPKFTELGDPNTNPFTPKSGQPMDWIPVPPPDAPGSDTPQTDTPQSETPPTDAPPSEAPQTTPQGETPPTDTPPPGDPGTTQPGGAQPPGDQPGGQPGGQQPGGQQPGGQQPGEQQPGEQPPGQQPPGDQPPADEAKTDKILETARGELGYEEGPNNENKYGPPASWCSSFATWVWRQSGVDIPSYPFTGDVYNWGVDHGLAYDSNNLGQARPGDVLLFGTGPENTSTSTHIGVVESVDGGNVTLIEGNSSDRVQRVTYSLSGDRFYGGVHPQ